MKLKNHELNHLLNFVMTFELASRESRLRTRFARILSEYLNRYDLEHKDLINEYAEKDEEGNAKHTTNEKGQEIYDLTDENKVFFNKEYNILLNEDVVIEQTEERKEVLLFIKDMILDCDRLFKGQEALLYDRYCEIVEQIEY